MYLEQFIYLQAIAQYQSINQAADKLFISHQALSRAINNLEKELGCPLLVRNNRGVTFTKEGDFVLAIAKRVLDAVGDMEHYFQSNSDRLHGDIYVLFNQQEYKYCFSQILSHFYKNHPALTIHHQVVSTPEMLRMLSTGEADIGICNFIELNGQANITLPDTLRLTEFSREKLSAIFSKNSILNKYKKVSLKTLSRYPIIIHASLEDDLTKTPAYFLFGHSQQPKMLTATSDSMFIKFLEDNLGWAVCPPSMAPNFKCASCPLRDNAYAVRGYIVKQSQTPSPLSEHFLSIYTNFFA